jgi:hypothetical protein
MAIRPTAEPLALMMAGGRVNFGRSNSLNFALPSWFAMATDVHFDFGGGFR